MTSHVITVCCAEAEGAPRQRDGLGAVGCSVAMGSRGRLSCRCNPATVQQKRLRPGCSCPGGQGSALRNTTEQVSKPVSCVAQ